MREFHKMLDVSPVRPSDWIQDHRVVTLEAGPAKILTSFTQEEKHLIFKRKILVLLPKKGGFTRKGRSPNEEEKHVFWLIRDQEGKIHGPFTNNEMQEKIKEKQLTGFKIKRDDFKDFVDYDALSSSVDDVLNIQDCEKYLKGDAKKAVEEKGKQKASPTGSRYDILFMDDESSGDKIPKKDDSVFRGFEKDIKASLPETKNVFHIDNTCPFVKTREFLRQKKCPIDVQNIVQKIHGKTKINAINIVCLLTTMNKEDCERLITLISKESREEILTDDNADGFVKVFRKQSRR